MKNLKPIYLSLAVMAFIMVSCNNQNKEVNKDCSGSYELKGRDTVNVIDCHGKQGKWVPSIGNKLQDTIYYRNDTIMEKY
jgi:hypothetical protein